MKVCIIQPLYTADIENVQKYIDWEVEALDSVTEDTDIIVLPESCDIPAFAQTREQFDDCVAKYSDFILEKAAATAKRCSAMVFINSTDRENLNRNTTFAFDREGNIIKRYFKQHLTPGESAGKRKLGGDYSFEFEEPTILEWEGIRFAFLTCYDFYFYEAFANIARYDVDVIIGCSHQRTDTHRALELNTCFASYQCNAYVLRASVSMGENEEIGGCSMITNPRGEVVVNMKSRVGVAYAEIDPHDRYFKPAGYRGKSMAHFEYVEKGRRPYKYRPGGSAIVADDDHMKYPRVCAHRGFNAVAPENSLPAYGAAVAMGAEEIEFDVRVTKDGVPVSIHDGKLDRTSDGVGNISDYTYEELLAFDFGVKKGEAFRGMKILKVEEILAKFSCHTIMNVHLKTPKGAEHFDADALAELLRLFMKYDCEKYVYFMSGHDGTVEFLKKAAPHIPICMGAGSEKWEIVDRAIKYGCKKVQLFKPYFNQEMVDKARAHGIICNVFWSDDPEETRHYLDMGIDTILSNDYFKTKQVVDAWKAER